MIMRYIWCIVFLTLVEGKEDVNQMDTIQQDLLEMKTELRWTIQELKETKTELMHTKANLKETKADLKNIKSEMNSKVHIMEEWYIFRKRPAVHIHLQSPNWMDLS